MAIGFPRVVGGCVACAKAHGGSGGLRTRDQRAGGMRRGAALESDETRKRHDPGALKADIFNGRFVEMRGMRATRHVPACDAPDGHRPSSCPHSPFAGCGLELELDGTNPLCHIAHAPVARRGTHREVQTAWRITPPAEVRFNRGSRRFPVPPDRSRPACLRLSVFSVRECSQEF